MERLSIPLNGFPAGSWRRSRSPRRCLSIPLNGFLMLKDCNVKSVPGKEASFNSIEWIRLRVHSLRHCLHPNTLSIPLNGFYFGVDNGIATGIIIDLSIPLNGFSRYLEKLAEAVERLSIPLNGFIGYTVLLTMLMVYLSIPLNGFALYAWHSRHSKGRDALSIPLNGFRVLATIGGAPTTS